MLYRSNRLFSFIVILPALAALSLFAVCATAAPTDLDLHFTALRSGDKIGPHTILITKDGDTTTIKIKTRVAVKIAFITVYRFDHDSTEVWHKGQFWSLQAKSNENGTRYQLSAHVENEKFILDGFKNGTPFHEELPNMPSASLWGIEMAQGTTLLNTLTGRPIKVDIKDLGQDQTMVHGVTVSAHHFHISGELVQDDWYDKDGYLVRKTAKGPDNSDVDFQLL